MKQTYEDPYYKSGNYLLQSSGSNDANFKIRWIKEFLELHTSKLVGIEKGADVGCGTGEITSAIPKIFSELGQTDVHMVGFDIHPQISQMKGNANVRFIDGDILKSEESYDIVFLIDFIEHIVEPVNFLNRLSKITRWLVAHIPLDASILSISRDLPRENLIHPGHVSIFDTASALNLITNSGFRLLDYKYTPSFKAPSGRETGNQKLMFPLRTALYKVSPYLTSKTIGGSSLLILALSIV